MSLYSFKHVGIWVNLSQARICAWREHDFGIIIKLRLDLGTRGLKIASTTNLKLGPGFAEVCIVSFFYIFRRSSEGRRKAIKEICDRAKSTDMNLPQVSIFSLSDQHSVIQWGSEIRTDLDFEWSKRG